MKKKKVLKIARGIGIITGIILIVGVIGTCYFTAISVFNGSMQMVTNEDTSIEKAKSYFKKIDFDVDEFQSKHTIETLEIESTLDGHTIPVDFITMDGNKNVDMVIMVHGLGGSRWTNYPIANMFLQNGYGVISFDQRSSGENKAQYTTYGYLESRDVEDCIAYLKDTVGHNKKVGIWGTSFGGATAGIYLGSEQANENINFAILDCPISNMRYMLSTQMESMDIGIPVNFMMFMGNMATKMKLGFSYEDTNVCNYVSKTRVPILVINSKVDEITPYFMGEDIYNSITHSNKKIFTSEDSKHVEIFFDYPDEYESTIFNFIKQIS